MRKRSVGEQFNGDGIFRENCHTSVRFLIFSTWAPAAPVARYFLDVIGLLRGDRSSDHSPPDSIDNITSVTGIDLLRHDAKLLRKNIRHFRMLFPSFFRTGLNASLFQSSPMRKGDNHRTVAWNQTLNSEARAFAASSLLSAARARYGPPSRRGQEPTRSGAALHHRNRRLLVVMIGSSRVKPIKKAAIARRRV